MCLKLSCTTIVIICFVIVQICTGVLPLSEKCENDYKERIELYGRTGKWEDDYDCDDNEYYYGHYSIAAISGMIVGAVLIVVGLALGCYLCVCCCCSKRRRSQKQGQVLLLPPDPIPQTSISQHLRSHQNYDAMESYHPLQNNGNGTKQSYSNMTYSPDLESNMSISYQNPPPYSEIDPFPTAPQPNADHSQ